jgi:hypothetical protein
MSFIKIVSTATKLIAVMTGVALTPALLIALLAPKAPIAPKTTVTAPNVVTTVKPAIVAPKTTVTAPKSKPNQYGLIVPSGCKMALDATFTQAEVNEFCAPKPTADQIAREDRKMIDAHIARLKEMGR